MRIDTILQVKENKNATKIGAVNNTANNNGANNKSNSKHGNLDNKASRVVEALAVQHTMLDSVELSDRAIELSREINN